MSVTVGSHEEGASRRFAARLREARLAARGGSPISQQEIAATLGLSQATISDYERGRRSPSLATLQALARMLGVSTDWLLGAETTGDGPGGGLLHTSLLDLLGLSRLTYMGEAGMASDSAQEFRAAEARASYPAPALIPGRPLGISREMSGDAEYAILYTGPARAGLVPGDLLLVGPGGGHGSTLHVISHGQGVDPSHARLEVVPADAPARAPTGARWPVLAIWRRLG